MSRGPVKPNSGPDAAREPAAAHIWLKTITVFTNSHELLSCIRPLATIISGKPGTVYAFTACGPAPVAAGCAQDTVFYTLL
ncbi:hypothetical protein EVAR_8729_1 [Eumeta japonica]|uniref:Uncharacterized protein n=1 Tax=Eumeta variegata TaxID=151549 RepID=A0A4C1XL63_EUMVA|nr:hypothetical protein EVAR_8729_1 [Eumeta japonica]